jgi:hypothetical protein
VRKRRQPEPWRSPHIRKLSKRQAGWAYAAHHRAAPIFIRATPPQFPRPQPSRTPRPGQSLRPSLSTQTFPLTFRPLACLPTWRGSSRPHPIWGDAAALCASEDFSRAPRADAVPGSPAHRQTSHYCPLFLTFQNAWASIPSHLQPTTIH